MPSPDFPLPRVFGILFSNVISINAIVVMTDITIIRFLTLLMAIQNKILSKIKEKGKHPRQAVLVLGSLVT